MQTIQTDLNRFYELIAELENRPHQGACLNEYSGRSPFPARGVYFFREPGEYRTSDPDTLRIVRVGTHAVSTNSKSTLWSRLRTHLGARHGGGNHRGSIFRLHVGAALLARERISIPTWGIGSTAPVEVRTNKALKETEVEWERKVSAYIGAIRVVWVNVPDEPGTASMRARIEQNAIALLSNSGAPLETAHANWLGHFSPRPEIRKSCLWNLNHVYHTFDPKFLDDLEQAIATT